MKKFLVLCVLSCLLGWSVPAFAVSWGWDTNGNLEGWGSPNQILGLAASGGAMQGLTNGGDPFVYSPDNLNLPGSANRWIKINVETTAISAQTWQIFFITNADGSWAEAKSVTFTVQPGRDFYQIHVPRRLAEESKTGAWDGQTIRRLRLDTGDQIGITFKIHSLAVEGYPHPDWPYNILPPASHPSGWFIANQITNLGVASDGTLTVSGITGNDPHFQVSDLSFDPNAFRYLLVRYSVSGFANSNGQVAETFAFPGTGPNGYLGRPWYCYPNLSGYVTAIMDMHNLPIAYSSNVWPGAAGSITSFRIDPAITATGATYKYDRIALLQASDLPATSVTREWPGMSGVGSWEPAQHGAYAGSFVMLQGGMANITQTITNNVFAIENLDFVVNTDGNANRYLYLDVEVASGTPLNDLPLTVQWAVNGRGIGDEGINGNMQRRYAVIRTNQGVNRYVFDLATPQGAGFNAPWDHGAGANDSYIHGLLLAFGLQGQTSSISSVKVSNVGLVSVAPPQIQFIENETVPDNAAYAKTPSLAAGTPPITWSKIAGPSGLTVNASTGQVNWPSPTVSGSPHTVTIRATNSAGYDEETWAITVTDATPPVITVNGANPATVECGASYTDAGATATDNVSGNVPVTPSGTVNTAIPGTYTITYTAQDGAGNTATATRTVNVVDTTAPVVTINGGNALTVECGVSLTLPGATWTDACAGSGTAAVSDLGGLSPSNPAVGVYSVEYSGSDGYNTGRATLTVTVKDTTAPVITVNGADPLTVECGTAFTDPGASATDQCVGSVTVTASGTVNTAIPGSYMLMYTADDGSGNTATATRVVNVVDTTAPVITVNGADPLTVECGTAFTDPGASATDQCVGSVTVATSGTVNTAIPGTYTITYIAQDGTGNTATATRTVNVVDTTAPVITVNGADPLTVECSVVFSDPGATASDQCVGTVSVSSSGTVNTAVPGSYTITYTANDGNGNTATATRTVNVVDTTAPVITVNGANPTTVECGSTYTDAGATASDQCVGTVSVSSSGTVNTAVPGSYTITYTANDGNGNTATATRTVNVVDSTAPVVTISGGNTLTAECGVSLTLPAATWTDTCAGNGAATVSDLGGLNASNPAVGVYSVIYSGSDGYNTGAATLTVTVTDTTAPVVTINGPNPVNVLVGGSFTPPSAVVTDGCDPAAGYTVSGSVDVNTLGTYLLTYTATDASSNTASVTLTVNVVNDVTPPVITLAGDNPLTLSCGDAYVEPGATATDDVDGDVTGSIVISGQPPAGPLAPGSWTVTYSVSDSYGNTATATRTVVIQDNCPLTVTATGTTLTVPVGGRAEFAVTVTGAIGSVTYQWFRDDGSKAWVPLSGENGDTLVIDPVSESDAGQYQCEVSDSVTSVTSPVFTLVIGSGVPVAGPAGLMLAGLGLALLGARSFRRRA